MRTIAYIASQFPLRSETFVWREVRELRRRGWTVHTFGLRPPAEVPPELADLAATTTNVYGERWFRASARSSGLGGFLRAEGTSVHDLLFPGERLSFRSRLAVALQAEAGLHLLAPRLRKLGVQHIHAHFAHAPAGVAMYAATALKIPFSFTGHANDLFQRRQLLKRKLERASFVCCISEWHRALYQSIVPRDDAAYPVVRCGVDVDQFAPPAGTKTPAARSRLLTVCRLVEKKGVDLLLRAIARLPDAPIDLTIAGDGPLREQLERLVDELNVRDRVTFLGAVDAGRVRELLLTSDAFALPCRVDANGDKDGIPVVLIEAMACGLPVVSGDLPAIRELVVDGETGLMVDASNIDSLADAIRNACGGSPLALALGESGRKRVVSEFSLTGNVDRLETLFTRQSARNS